MGCCLRLKRLTGILRLYYTILLTGIPFFEVWHIFHFVVTMLHTKAYWSRPCCEKPAGVVYVRMGLFSAVLVCTIWGRPMPGWLIANSIYIVRLTSNNLLRTSLFGWSYGAILCKSLVKYFWRIWLNLVRNHMKSKTKQNKKQRKPCEMPSVKSV